MTLADIIVLSKKDKTTNTLFRSAYLNSFFRLKKNKSNLEDVELPVAQ